MCTESPWGDGGGYGYSALVNLNSRSVHCTLDKLLSIDIFFVRGPWPRLSMPLIGFMLYQRATLQNVIR